jgi:predicted Zn-dependent protease
MLLTETETRALAHKILSTVKADDAQVNVGSDKTSHLRFARNAFLTSGTTFERTASITVWIDGRRGGSSTSDLSDKSVEAMVREAEKVASISPKDLEYLPTLGEQIYKPFDGYDRSSEDVSYENRAKSVAAILSDSEKQGVVTAGFHECKASAGGFATKNGNFGFEKSSVAGLSVTARSPDGSSSGYFQRSAVGLNTLDAGGIARESIRKCVESRGARETDPGVYSVILEPQAVGDLIGGIAFQFDARNAEEGRSPFSMSGGKTKLGEKIFDARINILSDPWDPEIPGSSSSNGGVPSERMFLVKEGVLENLVYNRFWAAKSKRKPSPGPANTILRSASQPDSLDNMIGSTKRGLLISRFWYIRSTDPRTASVTGLTRDGVWLIENGKISHPVNNFRFNQSIIAMLADGNVEGIGKPERVGVGNASLLPALKLREFSFTSRSDAV